MPANLTPEYEKAELRYRQAGSDEERITALQDMLAAIPKHKGTEKMQADLKRRLSQLRKAGQKSSASKGPDPFHIPKTGAGQVVLTGPPNSGKSTLLAATTHAEVKVADYPFTTTLPQPGIWYRDDLPIELVDTPPITPAHVPPGLMGTLRNSDVVCVVLDGREEGLLEQSEEILGALAARGLELVSVPARDIPASEPGKHAGLMVVNKAELGRDDIIPVMRELYPRLRVLPVSARTGLGLDEWFRALWELLGVIRVYAKAPGKPADMQRPFVLPAGATVADLARQIHRDLPEQMKYARLWGHSRFDGQQVHKTEELRDRDVVEIHE